MGTVVILGASSGVGRALSYQLAKEGSNLILCSRSNRDLETIASNLRLRCGVEVTVYPGDINVTDQREAFLNNLSVYDNITEIYISIGDILDKDDGLQNPVLIDRLIKSNFLSLACFLSEFLQTLDNKTPINIAVISSVAIARPRRNNLVYAASKAGIDFYCRGLQHLFVGTERKIVLFRLGYIDTAMTFGKKLMFQPISAERTAEYIISRLKNRKSKRVYFFPGYWKYITLIIKMIPWQVYKKLSF